MIVISLKYNKALIQNARNLRKNQTPQERKLWYEFLSKYPIRFQRQKVIDNYIADFYCALAALVIELDGGGHYTTEQMEYDTERTNTFEQYGLMVLRFTNIEIMNNFYGVCSTIDAMVKKRVSLPQPPVGGSPLI